MSASDTLQTATPATHASNLSGLVGELPSVLVIELEGGMIHGTLREEIFWAAQAHRFSTGGQAPALDVEALPYRETTIDLFAEAKAQGRTVYLTYRDAVADTARAILDKVALIDGVKSHSELVEMRGFGLVGAAAGHPGLKNAAALLDVDGISSGMSGKMAVHRLGQPVSHIRAAMAALRPHQWAKNTLVFVPLLAGQVLTSDALISALLAFVAFSFVASSVYILNDLLDLAADRAHPRKCNRPFASGALPLSWGVRLALGLLAAGTALALFLPLKFLGVLALYYVITLAYSFVLKRRTILDICALAGLYTMRIVAGGAAAGVDLSVWLLAFSIFFFLALAAIKRQAELVDAIERGTDQPVGRGYRAEDITIISQMAISASYVSVLVMALYLNTENVRALYASPTYLWGICLILLYWLSRAVMKTHRGEMHDDPVVFALKDKVSLACLALVLVLGVIGAVF